MVFRHVRYSPLLHLLPAVQVDKADSEDDTMDVDKSDVEDDLMDIDNVCVSANQTLYFKSNRR